MIYNVFYINELLPKVQVNNYVIIFYDHACSDWSCDCDKIYNKKSKKKLENFFLEIKKIGKKKLLDNTIFLFKNNNYVFFVVQRGYTTDPRGIWDMLALGFASCNISHIPLGSVV